MLLEQKVRHGADHPHGSSVGADDRKGLRVGLGGGVRVESEKDSDEDGENDNLAAGAHGEGHVGDSVARERFESVVLLGTGGKRVSWLAKGRRRAPSSRRLARDQLCLRFVHLGQVASELREGRRPEGEGSLVGDD